MFDHEVDDEGVIPQTSYLVVLVEQMMSILQPVAAVELEVVDFLPLYVS